MNNLLFLLITLISTVFASKLTVQKEIEEAQTKIEQLEIDIPVAQLLWKESRTLQLRSNDSLINHSLLEAQAAARWEELLGFRTFKKHWEFRNNQLQILLNFEIARDKVLLTPDFLTLSYDSLQTYFQKSYSQWSEQKDLLEEQLRQIAEPSLIIPKPEDSLYLPKIKDWNTKQSQALQARKDSFLKFISKTEQSLLVLSKGLDEWDSLHNKKAWNSRWEARGLRFLNIWNFQLYQSEGTSITLGKVLLAIMVSLLGIRIARRTAHIFMVLLNKNLRLEAGQADAGQRLLYYLFSILFVLYALHLVQFPLTAFTFLGGALAIGFGFGSQAIMNNFISGLILLIERPVKRGDFIQIDEIIGTVETIGPRSTRIRTTANVHLVVPNSSLLENKLTNWTLSDRTLRLELTIGVAYGSPVEKVKQCLLEIVRSLPEINKSPEPIVLFADFADSALIFETVFWTRINELVDRRKVLSKLRFMAEAKFAEENITIAFPQRDIHLDTQSPLQIKIIDK